MNGVVQEHPDGILSLYNTADFFRGNSFSLSTSTILALLTTKDLELLNVNAYLRELWSENPKSYRDLNSRTHDAVLYSEEESNRDCTILGPIVIPGEKTT